MERRLRMIRIAKAVGYAAELTAGAVIGCVLWMSVTLTYAWDACLTREDLRSVVSLPTLVLRSMKSSPTTCVGVRSSILEAYFPTVRFASYRYFPGGSVGGTATETIAVNGDGRQWRIHRDDGSSAFQFFSENGMRIDSEEDAEIIRQLRLALAPVSRGPIFFERWSSRQHERRAGEWRLSIEHDRESRRFFRVRVGRGRRILDGKMVVEPLNGAKS